MSNMYQYKPEVKTGQLPALVVGQSHSGAWIQPCVCLIRRDVVQPKTEPSHLVAAHLTPVLSTLGR
jgi:hypothetical protein